MSCSRWIDSDTLLYLCHHHDSQLDYCLHVPLQLHSYVLSIAITTQASRLLHTRVWLVNITHCLHRSPSLSQQSGLLLFYLPFSTLVYCRLWHLVSYILYPSTCPPIYPPTCLSIYLPITQTPRPHTVSSTRKPSARQLPLKYSLPRLFPPFVPPKASGQVPLVAVFDFLLLVVFVFVFVPHAVRRLRPTNWMKG